MLGYPERVRSMSFMNKYFPLRTWYINAMQVAASESPRHRGVEMISYHIPKCGGTSFSATLNKAYGKRHLVGVYHRSHLLNRLTNGDPVWIPRSARVLHGMFRPHRAHATQFPEAKKVIWLRDPLDRIISLLQYWLREGDEHDRQWGYFKSNYPVREAGFEELLNALLTDDTLFNVRNEYSRIVDLVTPEHFDFVGTVENFSEDLTNLGVIMDRVFREQRLNTAGLHPLTSKNEFKPLLANEYEAYDRLRSQTN